MAREEEERAQGRPGWTMAAVFAKGCPEKGTARTQQRGLARDREEGLTNLEGLKRVRNK